jgi:hypothetical protein
MEMPSMGVVESINKNKTWSIGFGLAMVAAAGILLAVELKPPKQFSQKEAYFSDDDGSSWYLDDINNIPPYDHNAKQGVRAVIYSYDNGSKQFCGYLMRFGLAVKKRLDSAVVAAATQNPPVKAAQIAYGIDFAQLAEVKSPGSKSVWFSMTDPRAAAVLNIRSPDGSTLDSVLP